MTVALHLLNSGVTCAMGDKCADPLIKSWNEMIVWNYFTDLAPLPDEMLGLKLLIRKMRDLRM